MSAKRSKLAQWFRARRLARLGKVLGLNELQIEQFNQFLLRQPRRYEQSFSLIRSLTGDPMLNDIQIDTQIDQHLQATRGRMEAHVLTLTAFIRGLNQVQRQKLHTMLSRRACCAPAG